MDSRGSSNKAVSCFSLAATPLVPLSLSGHGGLEWESSIGVVARRDYTRCSPDLFSSSSSWWRRRIVEGSGDSCAYMRLVNPGRVDLVTFSSSCGRHGGDLQGWSKIWPICSILGGDSSLFPICCNFGSSSMKGRDALMVLFSLWTFTDVLAAIGFSVYSSNSQGVHEDDAKLLHLLAERQPICIPLYEAVFFLVVVTCGGALVGPSGLVPGAGEEYPERRRWTRLRSYFYPGSFLQKSRDLLVSLCFISDLL